MSATSIADMPLYTHLDRIARGLSADGIGAADPIPPEQLFDLDQWHYHGTEAIRAAADRLHLKPTTRVLDKGAYAAQEKFYSVIARLYESGSLGGVRLVARTP